MGWNKLSLRSSSPLLQEAGDEYVYFVHSFHVEPQQQELITAVCDYGMEVTAAVGSGSVQAFQFHPEKSSRAGLGLLRAFKEWQHDNFSCYRYPRRPLRQIDGRSFLTRKLFLLMILRKWLPAGRQPEPNIYMSSI